MNSTNILLFAAGMLFAFILSMTIACYIDVMADPPEHYNIQSRALNYTDKDCYTKLDIELIVFGRVLHELDCENCDEID
jgi:uncharacterized membrane protein